MKKKLQIFISSTYTDLKEERQAAVSAILKAGHIPAGMELFAAGNTSQMETIKRWINDSDIFMLMLGGRYGSIEETTGLSYTELEYDYAVKIKKPFFAVIIKDDFLDEKIRDMGRDALEQDHTNKLKDFRKKVLSKISSFFGDWRDIQLAVQLTISDFEHRYDLKGWIHADEIKKIAIEPSSFEKEKKALEDKLKDSISEIKKLIVKRTASEKEKKSFQEQLEYSQIELRNLKFEFDSYRDKFENPGKIAPKTITAEPGGYKLIKIPGGDFMMGSPETEEGRRDNEGPLHKVFVPDFYMGQYPVTNKEYGIFLKENSYMKKPNYWTNSKFNQPDQPIVGVSWEDAQKYAEWSELRLPTEAEWEYACRAGTDTQYYTGHTEDTLDRAGWHENNSENQTHAVGQKKPNKFGLYDMHGNVWKWCEDDWHSSYNKDVPDDGSAWIDNPRASYRVLRGGGWYGSAHYCRSAFRGSNSPDYRGGDIAFHLTR